MDRDTRHCAHQFFSDMCLEFQYVVPFVAKWNPNSPVPAGALRMEEIKWPSHGDMSNIAPPVKSHFVCIKAADMSEFPVSSNILMNSYITINEKANKTTLILKSKLHIARCR